MRRPTVLIRSLQFVPFPDSCKAYLTLCASWARSEGWTQTLDLGMARHGLSHCATNGDPLVVSFWHCIVCAASQSKVGDK